MSTKDDVGGRMLDSVLRCFGSMAQSRKEFHGPSFCFSHSGEVLILCWVGNPWWGYRQGHAPLTWASLSKPPHSGQAACVRPQHRASGWMCQLGAFALWLPGSHGAAQASGVGEGEVSLRRWVMWLPWRLESGKREEGVAHTLILGVCPRFTHVETDSGVNDLP